MKDKISEAFGLEPNEISHPGCPPLKLEKRLETTKTTESGRALALTERHELAGTNEEDDYEYVRKNIKDLIAKGSTAIDDLLIIASSTEHPRIYEVLGQLLKTISDQNKDLIDIRIKAKGTKPEEPKGDTNIQNAMFIGSTADLLKQLKGGD